MSASLHLIPSLYWLSFYSLTSWSQFCQISVLLMYYFEKQHCLNSQCHPFHSFQSLTWLWRGLQVNYCAFLLLSQLCHSMNENGDGLTTYVRTPLPALPPAPHLSLFLSEIIKSTRDRDLGILNILLLPTLRAFFWGSVWNSFLT